MRLFFQIACLLLISTAVFAETFESGPQQVPLLELFSSEGCSSCPPADEWVNSLKKDKGLWKEFVPVVFHVDYWDYLGWKDPYASPEFSQRQRRYADSWGAGSVYTPGFVLNGRELRDWKLPRPSRDPVGVLSVSTDPANGPKAIFRPAGKYQNDTGPWIVHFAVLRSGLRSDVKRGENAGRVLPHDFVVVGYSTETMRSEAGRWTAVGKPSPVKSDELAVWVTRQGDETPVQAAGGELE